MEGDAAYVVQVPVRDEDCLLVHRRLRAAPDVKGQLAPGQYQACLLSGSQQHGQEQRHGAWWPGRQLVSGLVVPAAPHLPGNGHARYVKPT